MSKREKVILVIVFFVAVYGIYDVFLCSPPKTFSVDNGGESKRLDDLIAGVIQDVARENLSETEAYIITRAETLWRSDPFLKINGLEKRLNDAEWAASSKHNVSFTYTGYLELGDTRIAIINGREYEIGEELESVGYFVERIEPLQVVIRGKENQKTIIVPVKEEVF
jgi:hypothetical protein